jgi:hypothetical protein
VQIVPAALRLLKQLAFVHGSSLTCS